MYNADFLNVIKASFLKYLQTGSRSNEKLRILHGAISQDLSQRLNDDCYRIASLGFGVGREREISGRYMNKRVDIVVADSEMPIAGIAVKFIMSNYKQNSNNYFENMLGETANIRCGNCPYFQIVIIPERIPYYDSNKQITHWETVDEHNLQKYINLSNDNEEFYLHTPNKTLLCVVKFSFKRDSDISSFQELSSYFLNNPFTVSFSAKRFQFGRTVIYNDFEKYAKKIAYNIKSI